MSEQIQQCPNCGAEITELKGGLLCCPTCGQSVANSNHDTNYTNRMARRIFWVALVLPATIALASIVVGLYSKNFHAAATVIAIADLFVGAIASLYCGFWLSDRFCKRTWPRLAMFVFSGLAIAVVNLILIFAGCAANFDMRM